MLVKVVLVVDGQNLMLPRDFKLVIMLGLGIWQYQLWSVVQLIQMWNNVVKLYCHDIKEILFSPYATHVGVSIGFTCL